MNIIRIRKPFTSFIASILGLLMAIVSSIILINAMPASKPAGAIDVPIVNGTWTDGITTADDLIYKPYNQDPSNLRNGTQARPWLIMAPEDLAYLSVVTRQVGRQTQYYYALGADIDLGGKMWVPIGHQTYPGNPDYAFLGALDGTKYDAQGNAIGKYKIKNMTLIEQGSNYIGLIAHSAGINTFTNIDFEDVYVTQGAGYSQAAALVGRVDFSNETYKLPSTINDGKKELTIKNISVSGYIGSNYVGDAYVAGLVGYAYVGPYSVTVEDCINYATIEGSCSMVGGMIGVVATLHPNYTYPNLPPAGTNWTGTANTTVPDQAAINKVNSQVVFKNCVNYADFNVAGSAGGIAGYVYHGNFINCNNYGVMQTSEANSASYTGGILGRAAYNANFENCHNYALISGYYVGGLAGSYGDVLFDSVINNCHNEGALFAGQRAGGLIGQRVESTSSVLLTNGTTQTLTITDSYNTGALNTTNSAAGLVCYNYGKLVIDNCYNTAGIENNTTGNAAGFVAVNYRGGVEINDSYNTGEVNALQNAYVGGFIGLQYVENTTINYAMITDQLVKVTNSYNFADIAGKTHVGGFAGMITATLQIETSYNAGAVQGNETSAGGFVGTHRLNPFYDETETYIKQSYNVGEMYSNAVQYVGGFVGSVEYLAMTYSILNNGTDANNLLIARYEAKLLGLMTRTKAITYDINESYSTAVISASANAGALVGRFIYSYTFFHLGVYAAPAPTGPLTEGDPYYDRYEYSVIEDNEFTVNYSLAFATQDEENTLALHHSGSTSTAAGKVVYNYDKTYLLQLVEVPNPAYVDLTTTPDEPETIWEWQPVLLNLSRTITLDEFRNINTFTNIERVISTGPLVTETIGYDWTVWKMPTGANPTANNGFPYLYNLAGFSITLVIDGTTSQNYEATLYEQFHSIAYKTGKTFMGWSTLPNGAGMFYEAGEVISLNLSFTVLYAVFEDTEYYKITIVPVSAGAIGATYQTTESDLIGLGLYSLQATNTNSYLLTIDNPADTDFEGWQVWKPTSATTGEWYTLTTKLTKTFDLFARVNETFLTNYLMEYATPTGTTFKTVGELKFRAYKKYESATFAASIDNTNPTNVDRNNGQLKFNNLDARLDGATITSFPVGTQIIFQVVPNKFHTISTFTIFEDGTARSDISAAQVVDNQYVYEIPDSYAVTEFEVRLSFIRIEYTAVLNVQTKDGQTNLLTSYPSLVAGSASNTALVYNKYGFAEFTALQSYDATSVRYEFLGYKIWNHINNEFDFIPNANPLKFTINEVIGYDFLNYYASGSSINVIAVYVEKFSVVFNPVAGGSLVVKLFNPDTNLEGTYSDTNIYYEKGSTIVLTPTASSNYEFINYTGVTGTQNGNILSFQVGQNVVITANFAYKMYELTVIAENAKSKSTIDKPYSVSYSIDPIETQGWVRVGSSFSLTITNIPGFRFDGFYFRNAGGDLVFPTGGQEVSSSFLTNYLSLDNKIRIYAKFMPQFTFTTKIIEEESGMGSFLVEYYDTATSTYKPAAGNTFDVNTRIKLSVDMTDFEHFNFRGFDPVFDYEKNPDDKTYVIITLDSNRTVQMNFEAKTYNIAGEKTVNGKADNSVIINATKLNVGDIIFIMYTPESGQQIKSWKINGVDVNSMGSNVVWDGNGVTITVTGNETWFNGTNFNLNNEITTGLNDGILIVIIAVGVTVPVLLALFVIFFMLNAKKKKLIRAELRDKQAASYRMDTSSFISGLREGKSVGQVTDADVKAEMKRRKKNK